MKLISWISVGIQILHYVTTINSSILFPSKLINDKDFNRTKKSVVVRETRYLWNNGIIPYEFENVFTGPQRRLILQAMRHWEESTCIKFVKRNRRVHRSYILFSKLKCGCCAGVGMEADAINYVSIDDECGRFGTVLHELGHAIGFLHEHSHPNRDDYVRINFDNIIDGRKSSFDKLTTEVVNTLELPYDYGSIMHYLPFAEARSLDKQTIVPLHEINGKIPEIGQRIKLSGGDIFAANLLYNCSKCGKTFSKPAAIFSPPTKPNNSLTTSIHCEWTIRAAEGERLRLNITSLNTNNSSNYAIEFVEIRNGFQTDGPVLAHHYGKMENVSIIASNYLTVKFAGSGSEDRGLNFFIQYEAFCGGDVYIESNDTYYFESPNYPEAYQPYKQCEWYVRAPYKHYLLIKFDYFELEESEGCKNDFLKAQEGRNDNAPLIGTYCGKADNLAITSLMRRIYLKFFSDGSKQAGGFSATISAIPI